MSENNQFAIGLSKDVIIPLFSNLYFGAGLGIYIKNKINSRISSKFTFGQKYFLGFNLNEHISLEIFEKHISNGSITDNNNGYDFLGIAASYIF